MSPIHRTPCPGEASLISKASAGDLEAFNQLVLAYQDAVYNQACVLLSDHHLAEDAVQESFIKAYRGIDKFRGGSLFAWLLKIVTNTSFDMLRQSRRQRTIPLSPEDSSEEEIESPAWLADPAPSVQAAVEQKELTGDIYRMLDELPDGYRSVITLIDLHELDYREAADILKIPVGTVKSRLARARAKMKDRLEAAASYQGSPNKAAVRTAA